MKNYRLIAVILLFSMLLGGCDREDPVVVTFPTELPTESAEQPKDVAFTCYNYDFDLFTYYNIEPLTFYMFPVTTGKAL